MAIRNIVTVGDHDPVLRRPATPVRRVDHALQALWDDMFETMTDAKGLGLAAPQIGLGWQVMVASVPVDEANPEAEREHFALANPELLWVSIDLEEGQEGCLSIPGLYGDVDRHLEIRVRALGRNGRTRIVEASGLAARVLQHEIDHLNGVLFTERITSYDKLYTFRENEEGELEKVPYRPPKAGTPPPPVLSRDRLPPTE